MKQILTSRRNIILAGLALIVIGAVAFVLRGRESPNHAASPDSDVEPVSVRILSVAPLMADTSLEATGTVQAELSAPVATKVQGRVLAVFVREGDRVRRGQPLLRLDARDLDAAVNQARAAVRSAEVGRDNAVVTARMERSMSGARIAEAEAGLANAQAALEAARAQRRQVESGPRTQEKAQAGLAVTQAQSNLTLAQNNLQRMQSLYNQGAIARQQLDIHQSQYEVAQAQYETAVQGRSIAQEGSRVEDIRSAREAVRQAEAGVAQARAGVRQARAASLQADVRVQQIRGAAAQIGQGKAALEMASVTRDYATIAAPFDGVVTQRLVDPGALASPGVPLLTLQGGPRRLHAVIPESHLPAVKRGASVPVTLDAVPGKAFTGRVVEIAPQGDAASHTFIVKVNLPGSPAIRTGMFGRASLRTGTQERITIPQSAVEEREGLSYVYVVDKTNRARLRLVTVADAVKSAVPVLSGLESGENIVLEAGRVSDGVPVRVEGR